MTTVRLWYFGFAVLLLSCEAIVFAVLILSCSTVVCCQPRGLDRNCIRGARERREPYFSTELKLIKLQCISSPEAGSVMFWGQCL